MGEYAEMMLEGIVCEGCGEFMGGGAPGYPRRCRGCQPPITLLGALKRSLAPNPHARKAERHNRERHIAAKTRKPFECGHCQRLFHTEQGRAQHMRDKHAAPVSVTSIVRGDK